MLAWALLLKCSIVSYVDRPLVISSSSSSRSSLYWKEKSYSCRGEPSGVWVWQLFALRAKAEKDFFLNFFLCSSFLWHIVEVGRMLNIFLLCWNLFESPARESSDPKLVDWAGDTVPGLENKLASLKDVIFRNYQPPLTHSQACFVLFCHLLLLLLLMVSNLAFRTVLHVAVEFSDSEVKTFENESCHLRLCGYSFSFSTLLFSSLKSLKMRTSSGCLGSASAGSASSS